jgi:hypothetical protein
MPKPERTSPSHFGTAAEQSLPAPIDPPKSPDEEPKPPLRADTAFHLSAIGVVWLGG